MSPMFDRPWAPPLPTPWSWVFRTVAFLPRTPKALPAFLLALPMLLILPMPSLAALDVSLRDLAIAAEVPLKPRTSASDFLISFAKEANDLPASFAAPLTFLMLPCISCRLALNPASFLNDWVAASHSYPSCLAALAVRSKDLSTPFSGSGTFCVPKSAKKLLIVARADESSSVSFTLTSPSPATASNA